MDFKELLAGWQRVAGAKLLTLGTTQVTIGSLATVLLVVVASVVLSRVIRGRVVRMMAKRGVRTGTIGLVSSLINYAILFTGFAIALDTMGLDLGALMAGGALFAMAIGFAMQNITQNFVSGVILMTERSINPGDVLEVDQLFVQVKHIGVRSSVAKTRDGEDVIIPNSTLVQSNVRNLSVDGSSYRIRAKVGVSYSSDMDKVAKVLEGAAKDLKYRDDAQDVRVWMVSFGNNSVDFEVGIWIADAFARGDALSALNEAIWNALKKADITIAFPQLDVHFDPREPDPRKADPRKAD